jgi:hypothetical protein
MKKEAGRNEKARKGQKFYKQSLKGRALLTLWLKIVFALTIASVNN